MSAAAEPEPASDAARSASARVAELFERHGRMVYGICRATLGDAHDAEDATQQAFLSAFRAFLGGARVRDQGAWIATIARNECRGRISAGMRAPLPVPGEELAEVPHCVDEVERRLQVGELRDALAELPERQREAVVLRYVYGLRYGEVARALGLSRPATEALLFRARRAMRLRLRPAVPTALIVPLAVREELALAIPGFLAQATTGTAAVGVAGGVLAKLASAPAAAKLATATVAVSTVGAVGAVDADRPLPGRGAPTRLEADAAPVRGDPRGPSSAAAAREDAAREDESGSDGGRDSHGSGDRAGDRGGASTRGSAGEEHQTTESTSRGGRSGAHEDEGGRDQGEGADDEQVDSTGDESSEVGAAGSETDADGSESSTSARDSEDSGSSGPASGEPDEDESSGDEAEAGSSGSGSSGSSGSGSDDDSSHSGSDDEPAGETS